MIRRVFDTRVGALLLMFALSSHAGIIGRQADISLLLPPVTYDAGGLASGGVASADMNADGKLDLAIGTNKGLSTLLGNGDGTFQPAVFHPSIGLGASAIVIADVNGDGIPDLLGASWGPCGTHSDGCVLVYLGRGDGTFRSARAFDAGGPTVNSIAVADFNGDGKMDVAVTNCSSFGTTACGTFAVLMGRGDGTFGKALTSNSGGVGAWSLVAQDLNHDGKVDLVIANLCQDSACDGDGFVAVLLGKGNGKFATPVTYSSNGRTLIPFVADVNGDGNPDILVANGGGGEGLGVLLANGDGTFQPVVTYNSGEKYVDSIAVADIDGDGHPDVILATCASGQYVCQVTAAVTVLLGKGDGTFQAQSSYSSGGENSLAVATGDLNGDGHIDVAVTNCAPAGGSCDGTVNGVVSVLLNAAGSH